MGGDVQGGKREPCNLEASKRMIFSRAVNSRSEMGSLSSLAFSADPPTDARPFLLDPSSGEVTILVELVMMRMMNHCTLGLVSSSAAMLVYKHHLTFSRLYNNCCCSDNKGLNYGAHGL